MSPSNPKPIKKRPKQQQPHNKSKNVKAKSKAKSDQKNSDRKVTSVTSGGEHNAPKVASKSDLVTCDKSNSDQSVRSKQSDQPRTKKIEQNHEKRSQNHLKKCESVTMKGEQKSDNPAEPQPVTKSKTKMTMVNLLKKFTNMNNNNSDSTKSETCDGGAKSRRTEEKSIKGGQKLDQELDRLTTKIVSNIAKYNPFNYLLTMTFMHSSKVCYKL